MTSPTLPDVASMATSMLLRLHMDRDAVEQVADPTGMIRRCIDIDRAVGRSEERGTARRQAMANVDAFAFVISNEIDRRIPTMSMAATAYSSPETRRELAELYLLELRNMTEDVGCGATIAQGDLTHLPLGSLAALRNVRLSAARLTRYLDYAIQTIEALIAEQDTVTP